MEIEREREVLLEVTTMIWQPYLDCDLELVTETPPHGPTRGACVHIVGGWNGSISLECSPALVDQLATKILGPRGGTAEWQEVLTEFVNMTGGNVKSSLNSNCLLTLPKAFEGTDFSHRIAGTNVIAQLHFRCGDSFLVVRLHGGDGDAGELDVSSEC